MSDRTNMQTKEKEITKKKYLFYKYNTQVWTCKQRLKPFRRQSSKRKTCLRGTQI